VTALIDAIPYEVVCPDTREIERAEWLQLRKTGMGSSDAAPAMSMSPWTSAYYLYAEKRNLVPDTPDNERFLWGRLHEPLILREASRRGWVQGPVDCGLMLRSKEHPWMLANPDGLTDRDVVEAKTADSFDQKRWDIGVPDHYSIQAHHLMAVTGRRSCCLSVLFGGNFLEKYYVDWDPAIGKLVVEGTCAMWERIQDGTPPDPDGSEATMLALRAIYTEVVEGKSVEFPDAVVPWLNQHLADAPIVTAAKKRMDETKARLMDLMGDAEVGLLNGERVCTWKKSASGSRRFLFTKGN
jgi:putative phage-type endonuclease